MRGNSEDLIQLVRILELEGHYFLVVCLLIEGAKNEYRIGIQKNTFSALLRVFQTRPFDSLPGLRYQYFFTGSYSNGEDTGQPSMQVRIELDAYSTSQDFYVPLELLQNLKWFSELNDLSKAEHLKEP